MSEVEESATLQDDSTDKKEDDVSPDDGTSEENTPQESPSDIEKQEEAKLKAKFPMAGRPMSGHSVFLQKRLANRQKYFDSGDYQMAKQKSAAKARQIPVGLTNVTGDAIPTPETVPVRKASIIQPCKFTPTSNT
ncbi:Alpha-endosulfine [Gryllus bimaculatus]|nr:Alpha-endosulfine [Gryllus bimaculatus]